MPDTRFFDFRPGQRLLWVFVVPLFVACSGQPIAPPAEPSAQDSKSPAVETTLPAAEPLPAEAEQTDLDPRDLFRLLVAEVAGQRGNVNLAVKEYLDAARSTRDPRVIERATRIAVYARDNDAAMQAAKMWTEVAPNSIEAHQVAAAMYVRLGDSKHAHDHLEKVITLSDKTDKNTFMLITSLLGKERDKQTAMDVMKELIATRKNNPEAIYAYAQLASLVGDLDVAESAARDVIRLKPDWAEAHILYSSVQYRGGKKVQSMQNLNQAVNNHPSNTVLRDYYARRLVDEKRYDEARQQFEALLSYAPDNIDAEYALGLLSLQTRDLDTAENIFKKLVKSGTRVNEASYYLGQIAEQQDKPDVAKQWYQVVGSGVYHIDAQIRLAMLEAKQGNLQQARDRLNSITPESTEIEQRLILSEGEILRSAKLYQEAYDVFNDGLARLPDNVSILYARALTAEKIDRVDVTLADLEKILAMEPNNTQALNALGYTMVDKTDRLQEGLKLIEKAYQSQPDDPAILDSMGWANYRAGNYKQALQYLRMAFDKLKDAEIAAHLGEVLWVTGDHAQARNVWDEALRETPSHKLLLDVIKRFTQ